MQKKKIHTQKVGVKILQSQALSQQIKFWIGHSTAKKKKLKKNVSNHKILHFRGSKKQKKNTGKNADTSPKKKRPKTFCI